jgi:hypothetical protein
MTLSAGDGFVSIHALDIRPDTTQLYVTYDYVIGTCDHPLEMAGEGVTDPPFDPFSD